MSDSKHYCTGCGEEARSPCVECGEWRCWECRTLGGWCASKRQTAVVSSTDRGAFCARRRGCEGHLCGICARGEWRGGVPRRIVYTAIAKGFTPSGKPEWVCSLCLGVGAQNGSRWREEPETDVVLPCQANICRGKHSGVVWPWWTRQGPNDIWTGPRNICTNAIALCREKHPLFEWRDDDPDKRIVPPADIDCEELVSTGLLSVVADNLGRDLARKMRVTKQPSIADPSQPLGMPHNCEAIRACRGRGTGRVVRGVWRDRYHAPDDWSRPVHYCDACIQGFIADDIGFEWKPIDEDPSQPLGMDPRTGQPVDVSRCLACHAVHGYAHQGYCDACAKTLNCCHHCGVYLIESNRYPFDAAPHCHACAEREHPQWTALRRARATIPKMETQKCTECGAEFYVPPYLMEGRCCNCHEAQAQRAHAEQVEHAAKPATVDVLGQTYCENAPPREIVESTIVMLDGDEVGGVPKMPFLRSHLCWNQRMKAEWERHEAWSKPLAEAIEAAYQRRDGDAMLAAGSCRPDHDSKAPTDTDMFGGRIAGVNGMRCKLCGGWIRIREAV